MGSYSYFGYVGDYPWTVQDCDSFSFRKIGEPEGDGTLGSPEDWLCMGESFAVNANDIPPSSFILHPCVPNPFNPSTSIRFDLPQAGWVRLEVFDTAGRMVSGSGATPTMEWYPAGSHEVTFDGSNLPSGIYLARLTAGEYTAVQKMVLLK
jgi:hypothetical protein